MKPIRQVVKDVPSNAFQVRPSDRRPGKERIVEKVLDEDGEHQIREFIPYKLDPKIATILGQVKALPKDRVLRIVNYPLPHAVADAWFAANLGITIFQEKNDSYIYYLRRS